MNADAATQPLAFSITQLSFYVSIKLKETPSREAKSLIKQGREEIEPT